MVITGGEPICSSIGVGRCTARQKVSGSRVETTDLARVAGIDWLCISPKAGSDVVQRSGDELKWVAAGGIDAGRRSRLGSSTTSLVQPMDCADGDAAMQAAIALAMARPQWRLTLQAHKVSGCPKDAKKGLTIASPAPIFGTMRRPGTGAQSITSRCSW